MHWFLYDETERKEHAARWNIPDEILRRFRDLLEEINSYIFTLRHAISQTDEGSAPLAVELQVSSAGDKLAAVINTQNLREINTREIVFFRHGNEQPRFVPVLSCQYEPLQYPLLFPHGTSGWGYTSDCHRNLPCT